MHNPKAFGILLFLLAVGSPGAAAAIAPDAALDAAEAEPAPGAPVAAAPRPDRVEQFGPDRPDNAEVLEGCAERLFTEATMHLAVFKDGACILDRGLRNVSAQSVVGKTGMIEETGLVDTAWVAPDGRGALLGMLRFTDRLRIAGEQGDSAEDGLRANTTLMWVDPSFPEGRFEVELEPGRVVKDAEALAVGFGAAVISTVYDTPDADFRLYSLAGKLLIRIPEREASATDIFATTVGGFVLVDLALVERPGLPERALRVYDLLQGTSWDYTWSYGSDQEPVSWTLADSGELEVVLPGATKRFDRNGKPMRGAKPAKEPRHGKGPFNRIRD